VILCLLLVFVVSVGSMAGEVFVIDDFEDGKMTWELMEDAWSYKGTDNARKTIVELAILDQGAVEGSTRCLEFRADLNSAFAAVTRVFDSTNLNMTSVSGIRLWLKATENVRAVILELQEEEAPNG
jgi:hypothetical protein